VSSPPVAMSGDEKGAAAYPHTHEKYVRDGAGFVVRGGTVGLVVCT